jgi:drug/metabolite transporter (DMT)-like permease
VSKRGWLLFVAMGVIWGVPYLLIKVAVDELTPANLVFFRTAVAALFLLPLAAARGQLRPLLRHWKPLVVYTAAELAVPWLFLASAERKLSSSLSGLLIAAVPLVGALIGWATGGERLGVRRLLGLFVGLAGVAALVGLDLHGGDVVPMIELAVVVVGYACGPFVLNRYLADLPGLGVVAASLGLTALVYLPAAVVQWPDRWPSAGVVGSVLTLAVVCTGVAFLVFFALIAEVGPVRATVITYINPAVAVTLGVLLLGEPFTVGIGVGFALVLIGSVLATRRQRTGTYRAGGGYPGGLEERPLLSGSASTAQSTNPTTWARYATEPASETAYPAE